MIAAPKVPVTRTNVASASTIAAAPPAAAAAATPFDFTVFCTRKPLRIVVAVVPFVNQKPL